MELKDVLCSQCMLAGASFKDKAEVLVEISRLSSKSGIPGNLSEDDILEGLRSREQLGSTGFGGGIAIPHCRLDGMQDFVVGVITIPKGVDFGSADGQKVKLVVFIIAPSGQSDNHVRLLSAISQNLALPNFVKDIVGRQDADSVYEGFLKKTEVEVGVKDRPGRNLFHVFVQDEGMFKSILQVLAGVESGSAVVMEAENISAYLSKMPLFADVWTDEPGRFSKVILMAVESGLTNEAIRRIESITGDLNKCEGVMVTVQPVIFAGGSLSGQY